MITPAFIIVLTLILIPVVRAGWMSLHIIDLKQPHLGTPFVGLGNYFDIFQDARFWASVGRTVYFMVVSISIEVVIGVAVAMLLNQQFRGRGFLRALILVPWALPITIDAIMWKWIYNPDYGLLNWFLSLFGFEKLGWLTDPKLSMPSIILMASWKALGRGVIIYLAALQNVPEQLYEAAEIDGAGFWHKVWHITIPTIMPIMSIMLILKVIGSLQIFASVYIMTEGGPMYATEVVAHYIYNTAFRDMDMGYATAMAMLMFLVLMFVTYIQLKLKKS